MRFTCDLLPAPAHEAKGNILIDNNGHACLAGFNRLAMAPDQSTATFSFRESGSTRWTSPELFYPGMFGLKDDRPTKESDCHALGVVIYEVLSAQAQSVTCRHPAYMLKALGGERPRRPQGKEGELFTDEIWGILELCWTHQPHDRISANIVLLDLEGHPPLLRPSSNTGGEMATDSDGLSDLFGNQSDVDSGMFSPSDPWPIFTYPYTIIVWSIALGDNGPSLPPQTTNPRRGWLGRTWKLFGATTRKPHGV